MVRKRLALLYGIVVLMLSSCNSERNPIYDLYLFRMEVKEHCAYYTESDWETALEKYAGICERVDQMQLTREERLEIDKIKGEIAGYAATVAAQDVSDCIRNITDEISSFVEGFTNTFELPEEFK